MREPFTDPPARSCSLPEFKTEIPRFQWVGPDLSSRACAEQHPARRHASRLCIRPGSSIWSDRKRLVMRPAAVQRHS